MRLRLADLGTSHHLSPGGGGGQRGFGAKQGEI